MDADQIESGMVFEMVLTDFALSKLGTWRETLVETGEKCGALFCFAGVRRGEGGWRVKISPAQPVV